MFSHHHEGFSLTRPTAILVICAVLTACSEPSIQSDLESYGEKLSRVLEQEMPALARASYLPARLPQHRALSHELPPLNIDLLDFLEMGGCELQQIIADKNSSLGKLAAASTVLGQDVAFIHASSACIEQLDAESALVPRLSEAVAQKQQDIDKRIWNALFAGPEYREFWQVNLDAYPDQIDSRVEFALQNMLQIVMRLQSGEPVDMASLEDSLEVIRNGEAGALLESWRLVGVHLEQISALLNNRLERRPLCFKDMTNPTSEIFRNVVMQDFIAGIQKDVAVLNRRYYDVIAPLRKIEERLANVETNAYRDFRQARDAQLRAARKSVEDHVAAVRPLMVQCGFLPEESA